MQCQTVNLAHTSTSNCHYHNKLLEWYKAALLTRPIWVYAKGTGARKAAPPLPTQSQGTGAR